MKKKVVLLCQHFYPEETATGQLATELAEDLASCGYSLSVITARPTYFLDPCVKIKNRCDYSNINIYRTPNTTFKKDIITGRIINSLTYAFFSFIQLFFLPRNQLLLAYTNPPFLLIIVFLGRILFGHKYIVIVHDIYPDSAFNINKFSLLKVFKNLFVQVNNILLNKAEKIISIGRCMTQELVKRGVRQDKVEFIPNWSDGQVIVPLKHEQNLLFAKYDLRDDLIVEYSGSLSLCHNISTVIGAGEILAKEKIKFLFVSSGTQMDKLVWEIKKRQLKNFLFLPFFKRAEIKNVLTLGDLGLVIQNSNYLGINVPSKIYAYLAAGLPVLALTPDGSEISLVIKENKCGFVISPSDSAGLAEKIKLLSMDKQLKNELSVNARHAFEQKYDRKVITGQYKKIIDQI